jgi:hypothetical protein
MEEIEEITTTLHLGRRVGGEYECLGKIIVAPIGHT